MTVPLIVLFAAALSSQQSSEGKEPAFDVASVKPTPANPAGRGAKGGPGFNDPSLFSVRGRTLKSLILMAYAVSDYQVTGGPAWMEDARFDIDARPAAPATREQMLPMLRTLLAERFQLRLHHETKPVAMNVLTVAKGGPKFGPQFHPLSEGQNPTDGRDANLNKGIPMGGTMKGFAFLLRSNMQLFDPAEGRALSRQDVAPVLDQTGLDGEYEILLRTDTHEDWPALLEHQMGLALNLKKMPTDMLVIDSAAKPSGN